MGDAPHSAQAGSGSHTELQIFAPPTQSLIKHAVVHPQKVFALARVFGNIPEDLFSRSDEQAIFRAVAKAGPWARSCWCSTFHALEAHPPDISNHAVLASQHLLPHMVVLRLRKGRAS